MNYFHRGFIQKYCVNDRKKNCSLEKLLPSHAWPLSSTLAQVTIPENNKTAMIETISVSQFH